MKYDKEADETIWTSREISFKPQASLHAEIKQYKKGEPKVTIIEAGIGFRSRPYAGALLKRVGRGDIEKIITLLTEAKRPLNDAIDEWEIQKANAVIKPEEEKS